ncbi:MAG: hypothetical protein MJ059_01240 [Lachnospiraceae bacterium]|nr:hypothetical protein [Lachnospiraceae bacterium]
MKNKSLILLLVFCLCLAFTGCGEDEPETTESETTQETVESLCKLVVRNGFDFDLTELYAAAPGNNDRGDNLIEVLRTENKTEVDVTRALGAASGNIDLYFGVGGGDTICFKNVKVADGDIMNICYPAEGEVALFLNGVDRVDGEIVLSKEHQAEMDEKLKAAENDIFPNVDDPLTERIAFKNYPEVVIPYAKKMSAVEKTDIPNYITFNAVNGEQDPYVYNSNVAVQIVPIKGYDEAMSVGYAEAKKTLEHITQTIAGNLYKGCLNTLEITGFYDNGNSWECSAVAVFEKSLWAGYNLDDDLLGMIDVRYVGPTGYVIYTAAIACETNAEKCFTIGASMINNMTVPTNYSTAPKKVTKEIKNSGKKTDGSAAGMSDPGDYGTAYYWTDADGDIWYWNGYEDEFYAFGDHYSIDDDTGEVMENNDYGWGYDEYNEWSDPGDYGWDYDEDYYEANDYGWGEDYNNEWSDPGDYGWDYDEDYYEANDYGWGDDEYNEWSDPGDYGDYDY